MENQKVIVVGDPNIAKAHILAELASRGIRDFELIGHRDITDDMLPRMEYPAATFTLFEREPVTLTMTNDQVLHYPNHPPQPQYRRNTPKVSRNALCPCGCGRKSKRCCNK